METEKWSLLSGLLKDEISDIRALMIKSILHTDMAKHGDLVRNLTLDLDHDGLDARLPKNHNRCLSLLLHAADVSNPSKQESISNGQIKSWKNFVHSMTMRKRGVLDTAFLIQTNLYQNFK